MPNIPQKGTYLIPRTSDMIEAKPKDLELGKIYFIVSPEDENKVFQNIVRKQLSHETDEEYGIYRHFLISKCAKEEILIKKWQ